MSPEFSPITDPAAIYDIFREDQLAEENRGVIGYDPDPALKAQAAELQHQMHLEFCAPWSASLSAIWTAYSHKKSAISP